MPPYETTDIPAAELEVLQALWDKSPATVRDVMNELHDLGRQLAYTTVLTFLTRLEQKGFVKSDKSGIAYVYSPKVTRDKVSRSRLEEVLESFYDGAPGPLVLQLMREGKFTKTEIGELQQLIDDLDAKNKRRKRS